MKTHIIFVLILLILSACASKENLTASQEQKLDERQDMQTETQYSQIDGQAFRDGPVRQ